MLLELGVQSSGSVPWPDSGWSCSDLCWLGGEGQLGAASCGAGTE